MMDSRAHGNSVSPKTVYVSRFTSWAPGLVSDNDWKDWAAGKREFDMSDESPALDFAGTGKLALSPKDFALFKRRQSQISRMCIETLGGLSAGDTVKTVFVSFRGEIHQQLKINRMLIEDGDLGPAAFSQSVFNTPVALASIAFGLRAGYTAVYPGGGRFDTGFYAAAMPVLTGAEREIALVYADELCPREYGCPRHYAPFAFAVLLRTEGPGVPVTVNHDSLRSPEDFLKYLYLNEVSR